MFRQFLVRSDALSHWGIIRWRSAELQNLPNFLIKIFPESVIVNGAVVNVRNRGDKISMWLCETKPQESILKIGQTLKRRLGIDDKVVSYYRLLNMIVLILLFLSGSSWI